VRKRCSLADRKRCQVNRPVIYPYLYCKLISVYEKYRVSVKPPFFYQFTTVYGPFMLTWVCKCRDMKWCWICIFRKWKFSFLYYYDYIVENKAWVNFSVNRYIGNESLSLLLLPILYSSCYWCFIYDAINYILIIL
jgi:hypothetical protein